MARQFAVEDGNLQTRSIVTSRTVNYKDVDLTFSKKANNDIFKKEDAAAVKQAVKNILMTDFYLIVLLMLLYVEERKQTQTNIEVINSGIQQMKN